MTDDKKGVTIMLDGMNEKPIAIPFPFEVGGYVITNPDEWHWFRRHYNEMRAALEYAIVRINPHHCEDCLTTVTRLKALAPSREHENA